MQIEYLVIDMSWTLPDWQTSDIMYLITMCYDFRCAMCYEGSYGKLLCKERWQNLCYATASKSLCEASGLISPI